ncbi:hypothetical protein ABZV93_16120 [Actinopolymorpha sp. NPDC004070]|uniref:Acg family FMN-binding oxidoreductase n=1 Tax=Actinopolymorpha sp. NPDC004070 TaxID=3154548 RepID=UPI0033AC5530
MPRRHVLTDREERLVVDAGVQAPSVLNTQPWRFCFGDDLLEIWADPERQLTMADPAGRFMVISCGAATYNALLGVRYVGHEAWVQAHPRPQTPFLAAVVHFGVRRPIAADDLARYDMIAERHTNRGPYRDWRLPFSLVSRLEEAAEAEGGHVRVLTSSEVERVRHLVIEAERAQESDEALENEMEPWIGARDSADGIPVGALGPRSADSGAPVRDLDPHRHAGPRDVAIFEHRPTLAVLSTPGDGHKDWVRAGMALQRVLLTAGQHGVVASFLNAPIEELTERGHLHSAAPGLDHPQMVLRLGYPRGEAVPTPRRSADQVM